MKRYISLLVALFISFIALNAQRARFELSFSQAFEGDAKVYVQPRMTGDVGDVALRVKDGLYVGSVPVSNTGFYDLVVVKDNRQLMTTVYTTGVKTVKMEVEIGQGRLNVADTSDNRVLSAFSAAVTSNLRTLWTKTGMSKEELKVLISSYKSVADSLLSAEKASEPVVGFVNVWAYTASYDAYTSIPRAQNIDASAIGFEFEELQQSATTALDNDYAPLFYSTYRIIAENMPAGVVHLLGKLETLYGNYKNEEVRKMVRNNFIGSFISRHDYSADFEGGLSTLEKATEVYGLSDEYVKEYLKRKATIAGSPFPAEVVLEDAEGNVVDFSSFKGKYVYIDIWASWCGPCRKEVPYLKQLEEEMKGCDVVFLSISTDSDKEEWKKAMVELDVHGYQLYDRGGNICSNLNVKGIPFFLIYDKDGKLHTYGALRPSSGFHLKQYLRDLP